jgi:hypothetical protein
MRWYLGGAAVGVISAVFLYTAWVDDPCKCKDMKDPTERTDCIGLFPVTVVCPPKGAGPGKMTCTDGALSSSHREEHVKSAARRRLPV